MQLFLVLALWSLAPRVHAIPAAPQRVNKPCPPGCTTYGNCNAETGECECMFGFGGPDCSKRQIPACHNAPDLNTSIPAFGHFFHKNCYCHKQLAQYGCPRPFYRQPDNCYYFQFWGWHEQYCYVLKDLPEEQQFSLPPDGARDPKYEWRRGSYNRAKAEAEQYPFDTVPSDPPAPYEALDRARLVPIHNCTDRCNGRGWCTVPPADAPPAPPRCQCLGFYSGPACETPQQQHCYRSCSGRGTCLGGWCHCQPCYWGLGCTRSEAYDAPAWLPHPTKLRIYVYDIPEQINFRKPWQDVPALLDTMYLAEVAFVDSLLADGGVRTENPWEANLFFVPTYTIYYTGNIGFPARHFSTVFAYVKNKWPFWNMTNGRNHIAIATNDRGCCDLYKQTRTNPDLLHPIKIVHFAQAARTVRGSGDSVDPALDTASKEFRRMAEAQAAAAAAQGGGAQAEALAVQPEEVQRFRGFPGYSLEAIRMEREPCFRPEQDVAFPNYLERGWLAHTAEAYEYDAPPGEGVRHRRRMKAVRHRPRERPYLFYFHGFTKPDMAYSGGVRQGLLAMFGNTTRTDVLINKGASANHMLQSRFCLCPLGYGWGIRFTQAMHTGCVPVLVQDHIYPAFWDVVPYERFSVRINRHNLHRLFELLEAITPSQLAELQQGLADYHMHFVWHADAGGLAYNNTITSLHRRLLNMWTALFRGSM